MNRLLYFDAAAAARPIQAVSEFFLHSLQEDYYNSEATYSGAYSLRKKLHKAECDLSLLLTGAPHYQVIWGNSATGLFQVFGEYIAGKSIISTALEHPALLSTLPTTADKYKLGKHGQIIPTLHSCEISATHWIQSELGIMQEYALPARIRFLDAVQGAGKKFPLPEADIIVISGIKFGAPGGAAMIVNADKCDIVEYARYRRKKYRSERISVPLALTLTHAIKLRIERWEDDWQRISQINQQLREALTSLQIIPTVPFELSSPYILHAILPEQQGAIVVRMLSECGIYVAAGSACEAESAKPSNALLSLGFSHNAAYRGLRMSFPFDTVLEDGEFFIDNLKKVLKNY